MRIGAFEEYLQLTAGAWRGQLSPRRGRRGLELPSGLISSRSSHGRRLVGSMERQHHDHDHARGEHLLRDLDSPLVPGLLAGALLQVNRDPEFAAVLAADDDQVRSALIALVSRIDSQDRPLPAASTARWIQHLIDAAFFAAGEDGFDARQQTGELRRVVSLLLGERW